MKPSETLNNLSQKAPKALRAEKISQFLCQPNAHLQGNSFDASHLSAFLLNSKYSQPIFSYKQVNGHAIGQNSYLSQKSFSEKPSSFFISPDREKMALDYPSNYSNLNPLVIPDFSKKDQFFENKEKNRENQDKQGEIFNEKNNGNNHEKSPENDKKKTEKTRENHDKKSDIFTGKIMENNEKNHDIFSEKIRKNKDKNRQDLLIKNAYKSGILNIDNPLNDKSLIYQHEHALFVKRQEYLLISQERQRKMIEKYSGTSPVIEFFNKIPENMKKNPIIPEKISPFWNRKAHGNQDFLDKWKDTHTRVFSLEPVNYNVKRAMFLREKDVGKKGYTLISETSNVLEIKPREILKVLG